MWVICKRHTYCGPSLFLAVGVYKIIFLVIKVTYKTHTSTYKVHMQKAHMV